MRRRVEVVAVLFAWIFTTGVQWDVTQLFAWGRMFAGYAQDMTVTAAARKTFSGELCDLCRTVQRGREQQDTTAPKPAAGKTVGKSIDLAPLPVGTAVFAAQPQPEGEVLPLPSPRGRSRAAPPSPPPRAQA